MTCSIHLIHQFFCIRCVNLMQHVNNVYTVFFFFHYHPLPSYSLSFTYHINYFPLPHRCHGQRTIYNLHILAITVPPNANVDKNIQESRLLCQNFYCALMIWIKKRVSIVTVPSAIALWWEEHTRSKSQPST